MSIRRWMMMGMALLLTLCIGLAVQHQQANTGIPAEDETDYGLILADSDDDYLYVLAVMENSTASGAGVEPGDVVTDLDGKPTKSLKTFHSVKEQAQGDSAEMTVERKGQPLTVHLRNGKR